MGDSRHRGCHQIHVQHRKRPLPGWKQLYTSWIRQSLCLHTHCTHAHTHTSIRLCSFRHAWRVFVHRSRWTIQGFVSLHVWAKLDPHFLAAFDHSLSVSLHFVQIHNQGWGTQSWEALHPDTTHDMTQVVRCFCRTLQGSHTKLCRRHNVDVFNKSVFNCVVVQNYVCANEQNNQTLHPATF